MLGNDHKIAIWTRYFCCPICNKITRKIEDYKQGNPATTQEVDKEPCLECQQNLSNTNNIMGETPPE